MSGRNRLEALVGIFLGLGGLLVVGYLLVQSRASGAVANTPTPRATVELWDAYEQARTAAQAEANDARLVSASTQWRGASEQALLHGSSDWSFVFYSPARKRMIDVAVREQEAWAVVDETRVWVAPTTLAEGAWRQGPLDALLIFWAYGGREFLQAHPQATATLHLAEREAKGAVWDIAAADVASREALGIAIDDDTRQVLSVTVYPEEGS